jgi:hypothetical protein
VRTFGEFENNWRIRELFPEPIIPEGGFAPEVFFFDSTGTIEIGSGTAASLEAPA